VAPRSLTPSIVALWADGTVVDPSNYGRPSATSFAGRG
jgi:hypothetical protein